MEAGAILVYGFPIALSSDEHKALKAIDEANAGLDSLTEAISIGDIAYTIEVTWHSVMATPGYFVCAQTSIQYVWKWEPYRVRIGGLEKDQWNKALRIWAEHHGISFPVEPSQCPEWHILPREYE